MSLDSSKTLRSSPIQLHAFFEMVEDDRSEFRGVDDRDPAGPPEEPIGDLIQPIDGKAQGDAAVVVAINCLGRVPGRFRNQFGGFPVEVDDDLVGLDTAINGPRISKIGFEVEVVGDSRRGI